MHHQINQKLIIMKTYTTSIGHEFNVSFSNSMPSGYGHKKISVQVNYEGELKEFNSITSNMSDFDHAMDLEDQEKYESLYEIVESDLDSEIDEWIESIKN